MDVTSNQRDSVEDNLWEVQVSFQRVTGDRAAVEAGVG